MKLTALEWFEYLPEKQRDLAQAYFCKEVSHDIREFDIKFNSLSSAIGGGFFWLDTEEGHRYWNKICAKARKHQP